MSRTCSIVCPANSVAAQQQRVALARALVKESDLLLLDEPLVNLDYKLREELRLELRDIFENRKSCVVYATTEPLEALMMGGNTIVVDGGRVLQAGPTLDVYQRPATERIGEVFSDPPINIIDGGVSGNHASLGEGVRVPLIDHLANLGDGDYRWGVRADKLFLERQGADDIVLNGTVELSEISGSETFVHVAHNGVSWVAQEDGVHRFGLNEPIRLYVDPGSFFVFDAEGRLVAAPERRAATATGETADG